MKEKGSNKFKIFPSRNHFWFLCIFLVSVTVAFFLAPDFFSSNISYKHSDADTEKSITERVKEVFKTEIPPLDTVAYDAKILALANNPAPKGPTTKTIKDPKTGVVTTVEVPAPPVPHYAWPVKTPYPKAGAILPFNRILAYYGNLYSTKMGVLGEYPEAEMFARLEVETKKWEKADPSTPVVKALHYIVVTAQGSAGADGKYRFRMPDKEIDKVLVMAEKINAIVFLDIQVGLSTIQAEVPKFEKYWKLPNVHMGIDPEFSMKTGAKPGKVVGTYDAVDMNYAIDYMAKLVKEYDLPPKVLVIHRYTQKMLTNYQNIKTVPEVQVVIHMDGWGGAAKKMNTYKQFVYKEPVQFAGFKLFYKNDIFEKGTVIMSPEQLLKLNPIPSYIQYQ